MLWLLAQTTDPAVMPSEKQIQAVEIGLDRFLKGVPDAAKNESSLYLVIVVIAATLLTCVAIVLLFLRYLKNQDQKADAREIERQRHLESMADKYATEAKQSQRECHAHSREMITKRNEDSATFKDIAHHIENAVVGLTGTVKELAGTSENFKLVAHDMRGILQEKKISDELRAAQRPQLHEVTVHPPNQPKIENES
jgi:hypothetical protein